MRASMAFTKPESIEVTLTVTMPAKEWAEIRQALRGGNYEIRCP